MKSVILVILQFALILLLAAGTNTLNHPLAFSIFLGISFLLMVWAVAAMKQSRLRIMPDPHLNAVLITNGPYRYIRHPMYTAVLCCGIALLFANFSYLRLWYWIALAIVLAVKLLYEEKMLAKKFSSYAHYSKKTYRLIPLII